MNPSAQEEESPSARSYGLQKIRDREGAGTRPWFRLHAGLVAAAVAVLFILGTCAAQFAQAQVESVLHSFTGSDGTEPYAGLIMDSSGNLYGTAHAGGSSGHGTVFELVYDSPANSYTEKVLHSFRGSDGYEPFAGMLMDSAGNLYGTTQYGGSTYSSPSSPGGGTVFELCPDPTSATGYSEKVLYSFTGSDGEWPSAGLIMDSAGNLYGTTSGGGSSGDGTVFELVYDSSTNSYTEKVLYSFNGATASDGQYPRAGLLTDSAGNLYGTTQDGGSSTNCTFGCGTVFELSPPATSGGNWTEKVLYSFSGTDGRDPVAKLIMDSAGNLYTTALGGGSADDGTVFELVYDSSAKSYTEKVLHSFTGTDGHDPTGKLLMESAGNLYGTTYVGGSPGDGTVFELAYDSSTHSYAETVLYNFGAIANDGNNPEAGLVMGPAGNLYGTTEGGGSSGDGTVFGIAPVKLSATGLSFGSVAVDTTSAAQTVTVTNIGGGNFSYSAASISGANAGDFAVTNGCGTAVAPNGTCPVSVTFTPSVAGSETASLNLSQGGMTQTLSLTGTGVYPTTSFSASSLTFSSQDVGSTSSAQIVTLTNTGTVTLDITSVGVTGDFLIASNTCTASVAASQSCTVGVTFSPTAGGTRNGTLSFTDNAANSPQTVALSGTGEDFSLTPGSIGVTVGSAGYATFALQLSPEGGFNQAVSVACSGAPKGATCSVNKTPVTLDGTDSVAVNLRVTTTGNAMVGPGPGNFGPPPSGSLPVVAWLALLGLLGLMALAKFSPKGGRVRRAAPWATLALLAALCAGCGGGSSGMSGSSNGSTPAGTYTMTVTAKSGSLTHTTQVTLTVK